MADSSLSIELRMQSEKPRITTRFVVGVVLLVAGLGTAVYIFESDLFPAVLEAQESGVQLQVSFSMMLKGAAPLAVAVLGLKLIKSGSKAPDRDD